MNASTDFMVDMSKVGTDIDQSKLTCSIFDPRGNTIPSKLMPGKTDEEFRIMYTPFEAGRHTIELLYDNAHVPGSPFVVQGMISHYFSVTRPIGSSTARK